jgi:hypothetical protein
MQQPAPIDPRAADEQEEGAPRAGAHGEHEVQQGDATRAVGAAGAAAPKRQRAPQRSAVFEGKNKTFVDEFMNDPGARASINERFRPYVPKITELCLEALKVNHCSLLSLRAAGCPSALKSPRAPPPVAGACGSSARDWGVAARARRCAARARSGAAGARSCGAGCSRCAHKAE